MMTMEEIRDFAAHGGKSLFYAEDRLKDLVKRAAKNEQGIAEALKNGEVEKYAKLTAEKDVLAEMIRQQRDAIARQPRYTTRGEIIDVYNDEVEQNNAFFCKKLAEYQEGKKRLYAIFCELYDARKRMLADQHAVNYLVSDDSHGWRINSSLKPLEGFPLRKMQGDLRYCGRNTPADVAFFIESGLADGSLLDGMNEVFYS